MTRARILADYVSSGDELAVTTATADAALPKAGGAMTGAITTNSTFDGVDIAARDAIHAPKASPAFTGTPTGITAAHLEAGVLPSGVTGGSGLGNGITSHHKWYMNTQYYGTTTRYFGTTGSTSGLNAPATQAYAYGGVMSVALDNDTALWTFPSTGNWLISFTCNGQRVEGTQGQGDYIWSQIQSNISGTYVDLGTMYNTLDGGGSGSSHYTGIFNQVVYDVENTTTHKVRIANGAEYTTYWWAGISNYWVNFIRLGDT